MIWFFEAEEDDPPRIVEPVDGENLGTGATYEVAICAEPKVSPYVRRTYKTVKAR